MTAQAAALPLLPSSSKRENGLSHPKGQSSREGGSRAVYGCGGDFYLLFCCSKPIPPMGARVQPWTDHAAAALLLWGLGEVCPELGLRRPQSPEQSHGMSWHCLLRNGERENIYKKCQSSLVLQGSVSAAKIPGPSSPWGGCAGGTVLSLKRR